MKLKSDPRHSKRVQIIKDLFEKHFRPNLKPKKNSTEEEINSNQEAIDKQISKYAPAWPISQIAPIDLAVLRLAIYELIFNKKKEPYKVIIDEAVEIAKQYGNKSSSSFVNGVLGSLIKEKVK